MKTVLKYSALSLFIFASFLACDNTEDLVLTEPESSFDVNATNFANIVLNPSFTENPAFSVSWSTEAESGATYEVVMATDAEFSNPVTLGSTDKSNFTIGVAELNQMLLEAGLEPYKSAPVYVRINNGSETTSTLTYNITPYAVDAPVITNPEAEAMITLDGENPDAEALSITWTDFSREGTAISVVYELQIAEAGTDFETFRTVGTVTNGNEYNLSNTQLNNLALNLGAEEFAEFEMEIRIVGIITSDTGENRRSSESIVFSVTTYAPYPFFYVVGDFLSNGQYGNNWSPADAVPLAASANGQTDFEGFVYFENGNNQYKFLPTRENFDGDYGDTGDSNGSFSGSIEVEGEVNCGLPNNEAGFYLIQMNTGNNTYAVRKQVWSMIGAATPNQWNDPDTDMSYNVAKKVWEVDIDLAPGEFLFRANDNWNDYQDKLGSNGEAGKVILGGNNLVFDGAAGNYHVELDLSNPRNYKYTITAN